MTKNYRYNVVIGVGISSKEFAKDSDNIEKRLTSWERKALKAQEQFEKLSLAIEKAEKANNKSKSGGIDNAMLRAMAEIARMQRQIENGEKTLTRQLEREAKTQAAARTREMRRAANEMIREIDRVQKAEARQYSARRNLDNFGKDFANATFLGSFVGSSAGTIAGSLINEAISGISRLGSAVADVGLKTIQLGADFEQTTNSMIVFAGGTANAQRELAELDETARKTTGLRLADAEAGYKQLRALNFEIDSSRRLITGLAKQRLLSGANEQDVQRVIVNLTQLSAGSNRASQDIKEIFHTMPSLRREFALAFGTLDYQKIGKIFSDNPQEAIAKLSEQLEKAQGAAGGLNDAWGKMLDEFTVAGRELSKPVIPILTERIKEFTKALAGSSQEMSIFGVRFSNIISADRESYLNQQKGKSFTETFFPFYEITNASDEEQRQIYRRRQLGAMRRGEFLKGKNLSDLDGRIAYNEYLNNLESEALRPERETAMRQAEADAQIEMQNAIEKARQIELGRLESYYSEVANIRSNALKVAEIQVENNLELISRLHQNDFQAQIREIAEFYNKRISLNDGNSEEIYKLEIERNNKIRDIQANAFVEQLRLQRQIEEKKRQDLLAYNNLAQREISQYYDSRIADLQKGIDRENGASSAGFDELFNLIQKKSNLITQFTREQYEIRLQDTSLTAQQRINLEKEMYLALEDLARETYQNLIELNDRRFNKQAESLKEENQRIQESLNLRKSLFNSIENSLKPSISFGQGLRSTSIFGAFGSVDGKNILDNIQAVNSGVKTFYDAQKTLLDKQQEIERRGLNNQIQLNKDLLTIEKQRAIEAEKIFITNLQTRRENALLLAQRAQNENRLDDAENYRNIAQGLSETITERKQYLDDVQKGVVGINSAEITRLTAQGQQLETQKGQLQINQDIEQSNLKQISDVNYLNQLYQQIASGQKDNLISQMRDIDLAQERVNLGVEYRRLVIEANQGDPNANLKIQVAYLRDIVALRNQETDAIIQINRAQLLLSQKGFYSATQANARFLDFLNQNTKSLTEIYSDARIGVVTSFWDSLDVGISKVTDKLGVFGDILKQVLLDLIKLATSQFFAKLFGGGGGSSQNQASNSFGGFFNQIFGGNSNQSSGGFFNRIFSGGGSYQTPVFNPNAGSGIRPRIVGQVNNSSGGGGLLGLGSLGSAGISAAAVAIFLNSLQTTSPLKGALQGGLVGFLAGIFNRNKLRKREEKQRNQAMIDALGALDKLITDVNSDKIDGDQAISQAEEIRQNYLDNMRQLKDSKTRRIALADVARLDSKITALKAAATSQQQRKDKLVNFAPTFADGGAVSRFAKNNYRHNPLGYIQGPGTSRSDSINAYFPVADEFARISNREYVLDAETTGNIGVRNLDLLRMTRGRNFNRIFDRGYADGGGVGLSNLSNNQNSGGNSGNIELKAETKVYITQDGNGNITSVSTETILDTPQGKQKLEQTVADIVYENGKDGKIPTAINRVNRGQR